MVAVGLLARTNDDKLGPTLPSREPKYTLRTPRKLPSASVSDAPERSDSCAEGLNIAAGRGAERLTELAICHHFTQKDRLIQQRIEARLHIGRHAGRLARLGESLTVPGSGRVPSRLQLRSGLRHDLRGGGQIPAAARARVARIEQRLLERGVRLREQQILDAV